MLLHSNTPPNTVMINDCPGTVMNSCMNEIIGVRVQLVNNNNKPYNE